MPRLLKICLATASAALFLLPTHVQTAHVSFEPGDVIVSLEPGPVQWYTPEGMLRQVLVSTVLGTGEGMDFDPSGNLYVTRWCADPPCSNTGNTVEMFSVLGVSMGAVGTGYNCSPHAIVFKDWTAYVGQAGCSGDVLRFTPGTVQPDAFDVAPENQGSFWVDLAADGCTLFYTSIGPNVKRYDTCTSTQLSDFNAAPLPGGVTHDLRILPDGGLLVSSGAVIARLDASGVLVQTYAAPGENTLWAGLDLAADGTFWAANYFASNIHKFDIATGARLATFNTGTPPNTAVAVAVVE
jgi:outer membrane protein assembly factor BamB